MDNRVKGVIYISITALCWSLVVIALKMSVDYLPPDIIVWFRFIVSFSILFSFLLFRRRTKLAILKKPPYELIIAGTFLAINYLGILMGTHLTSPSTTQIVIQIGPLLFAVSGFVIFSERFKSMQLVGFIAAILGLILFYFEQGSLFIEDLKNYKDGVLWTITAGSAWSVYAVFQKKYLKKNSDAGQEMNLLIYGIPVIVYTLLISFTGRANWTNLLNQPFIAWGLLIFLGLNTLVAYGFLSEGMKYIKAATTSTIITLNPIITIIIMIVLTYRNVGWIEPEKLSLLSGTGAFMVITGAILVVRGK